MIKKIVEDEFGDVRMWWAVRYSSVGFVFCLADSSTFATPTKISLLKPTIRCALSTKNSPAPWKFIVKMDDDVMPNIHLFSRCFSTAAALETPSINQSTPGLFGWVTVDRVPDSGGKYQLVPGPVSPSNLTRLHSRPRIHRATDHCTAFVDRGGHYTRP